MQAKSFVGNEPFVVMLGDDIMEDDIPLTKQLINDYDATHASTLAVMEVPKEDVSKYGIINPGGEVAKNLFNVKNFVEKPPVEKAPSNMAIIGRYLLTSEIFQVLEDQEPGAGGEIQLTDAIDTLNKTQRVFAHNFTGIRYDVGDKFGYMKTSIEYGLKHPQIKDDLAQLILDLSEDIKKEKGITTKKTESKKTEKE